MTRTNKYILSGKANSRSFECVYDDLDDCKRAVEYLIKENIFDIKLKQVISYEEPINLKTLLEKEQPYIPQKGSGGVRRPKIVESEGHI